MFKLLKYNREGLPVNEFGANPTTNLTEKEFIAFNHQGESNIDSISITGDDKLICTGLAIDPNSKEKFGMMRIESSSGYLSVFPPFGDTAQVLTEFNFPTRDTRGPIFTALDESNGWIYVCGHVTNFYIQRTYFPPQTTYGNNDGYVIIRYLSDGKPDTNFGTRNDGAHFSHFILTEASLVHDIAVDKKGRLVVAGFTHRQATTSSPAVRRFALERFNIDGTVDADFGNLQVGIASLPGIYPGIRDISNSGRLEDIPEGRLEVIKGMVIDNNNRIYIAGSTDIAESADSSREMIVARFRESGELDEGSFGPEEFDPGNIILSNNLRGYSLIDFTDDLLFSGNPSIDFTTDFARCIDIENKNEKYNKREFLVIGGSSYAETANQRKKHLALVKLLSEDGNITDSISDDDIYDTGFGINGKVRVGFYVDSNGKIKAIPKLLHNDSRVKEDLKDSVANVVVVDQKSGDIIVGAEVEYNSSDTPSRLVLCKFNREGEFITNFGTNGVVDTGYNGYPHSRKGSPRSMAVDDDGNIYIAVSD